MEAATSTLADALLDDLDDLSDEEVAKEEEDEPNEEGGRPQQQPSRLLDDPKLQAHVEFIRNNNNNDLNAKQPAASSSTVQKEQEDHERLVQTNAFLVSIQNELQQSHDQLCETYAPKFPELEELIPDPMQYVNAVRAIGNANDLTSLNLEFLTNHQRITLSVAHSTTAGRVLTDAEMERVQEIVTYMQELMDLQTLLVDFVEQHINGLAPNMCELVGPTIAAQFLALTGGLPALAKIPACNLQVLGQVKQQRAVARNQQPHQGILVECPIVQQVPRDVRSKAVRVVAAKLALAIRCDFVNFDTGRPRSGASGRAFLEQVQAKFQKWQEPDKAPVLKALPKPDLTVKKRRGGKRMRRLKERYEETTLMKQANTRAFSSQAGEYGDDAMGKTLGLLDTDNMRKSKGEKRKLKMANTRASRKKAAAAAAAQASNTSGLASSVVFTAVQGMELVNPDANQERVSDANKKWFSEYAGFQSALPEKKN